MAFEPGLHAAAEAGVPVTRGAYDGVHQSLDAMARKIREGRVDPWVAGWARGCLKNRGLDGRDGISVRQQAEAVLDCLRAGTIYAPDAYAAEVISSAAATLCLRPGLCINGGDCDDLTVAYLSAMWSLNIPVAIVKQSYGDGLQQHVLGAVQLESGAWAYADPSTRAPFGSAPRAVDEVWIDPADASATLSEIQPEIVTLGKPDLGATPTVPLGGGYRLVTDGAIHAGLRYRFAVLLNFTGTTAWTPAQVADYFSQDWLVESAIPTPDVTGGVQSWLIQGVARVDGTILPPTQFLTTVAVAVQSSQSVSTTTPAAIPTQTTPPTPLPQSSGVPLGVAVAAVAIVAVGGGLAWRYWR